MIVVDCSYALALLMPDERSPASVPQLAENALVAPLIWPCEVASVLRSNVRRGRLLPEQVGGLCRRLETWGIQVVTPATAAGSVATLFHAAERHQLSPYDATYLELALLRQARLATLDMRLSEAAERAGIAVLH